MYCLENEQWLLPFNYLLFQIHFLTNFLSHSLFHLNIISSFIIYLFFNNYTFSNIFFIQYLIIIIKEKTFEEWIVAHQTWWVTVDEQKKKIPGIESPLKTIFMVSFFIIKIFMHLATSLEMLSLSLSLRIFLLSLVCSMHVYCQIVNVFLSFGFVLLDSDERSPMLPAASHSSSLGYLFIFKKSWETWNFQDLSWSSIGAHKKVEWADGQTNVRQCWGLEASKIFFFHAKNTLTIYCLY